LFLTLFLLFCRFLPMIAIAEIKAVLHHQIDHAKHHGNGHAANRGHNGSAHGNDSATDGRGGHAAGGH
jgi:molybdopterin-containing oxidoreductase family membrane subunit